MTTFEKITALLNEQGVSFRTVHHEPTLTSEASAIARGEDLSVGGKAIVMKIDGAYKLFVLSAALRVGSRKIKDHFNAKNLRFASADELMEVTGLVPGSVPPFGRPIFDLDVFVDNSIIRNDVIAFNAGSLTDSIIMKTTDYLAVSKPSIVDFAQA
ncbi:MAG TPA: YbaK/EbsC family protein [Bacteroidota bacterium]|nr:YbaK/EbsC family protein [Bacteroidota bacterium]